MNSNIKDVYSLTPAQEGIYVQHFQNNDAKTYHFHSLFEISKNSDLNLIKTSIELLLLRHPVLKTAFAVLKSSNTIKQVILENRTAELTVLSHNEPFSQVVLDQIIEEDSRKPLDLQRDSLFKTTVVEFTDKCFMLIRSHHIILDGWCFPIIINDLQKYYGELSQGRTIDELTAEISKVVSTQTSFAQYVNWLKNQDKSASTEYWQNLLDNCSYPHIFGKESDEIKKDIFTFRTYIDEETSCDIERYAKENRVPCNAIFESAYSIALQKFSGNDDIMFNKVISGRSIPLMNIENTIGLFVNTVPARVKYHKDTTVSDLIKESQTQTINANKYGLLALSEIYKMCNINSRSIDFLFVFENYYTGEDLLDDMEKGVLSPKSIFCNEQTEFNLSVAVFKEKNEYIIRTSYARDIYTETEISTFISGYISILKSYFDTSKKVKDIVITDSSIHKFNDTNHNYSVPDGSTLYSLFEKTAKENKDKVCLTASGKTMTFDELMGVSEALDLKLRQITDNQKSVIAVIAERSAEMYSAIYGIIRGGNAYVPIDPDYPQDRIDFILRNSQAKAIVTQGKFTHLAGDVPCIDMTTFLENTHNITSLPCLAEENDTAYVIYTSGSTGTPKGAKISHKSAVNRILWMHDKYPLIKDDVILQKTPYTFDVSVWELFWWGMVGGKLAASKPAEHFLPARILDEVENNKVTHLHFVPSVFELFLNYLEAHEDEVSKFDSVRYVFVSGEALMASLVQRFYALFDYEKVSLHNLYGPTECAVDVTYYDCTPDDIDPVPIGRPIYNTQMYIVDKYLTLSPIGVVGELCIAGINVGQGYLGNEKLTAEKFIDNPFGEGKLYKTGDLAYRREDGNIIFCGRNDFQVKINGLRIELSEIEAVICSINNVDSAAIIVKNINNKNTLVAFYTGEKDCEEQIKDTCFNKLPKYMVPGKIVHLDSLPLNSNGKLDKSKLADINVAFTTSEENDDPVGDREKTICKAFEAVLGTEKIGRNSDFFDLGGTSLSMISLLSRDGFENVTAAEFMRNSTPAKLACIINNKSRVDHNFLELLYSPESSSKALILLPFAGGTVEAYSNMVKEISKKNTDVSVYFIRYLHSVDQCQKASDEIATLLNNKDVYIYSHCVGSAVAIQIIKFLEEKDFPVSHYFAGASIPPLKPSKNNLWNVVPDTILKRKLLKAGAVFDGISAQKLASMFKSFRNDTDFSSSCFFEFDSKLRTSMSIILCKSDIFTKNYAQADEIWDRYFEKIDTIHFIDSESHYFQKDNSNELVRIIMTHI